MIGIEWDVPASLTTNAGTLNFNVFPGLVLDPKQCSATKTIRAPIDPIPQGDGDIIHRRFQTGYTYKLTAQAFESVNAIACNSDARLMFEELALHLYSMLRDTGRYCWIPSNYGDTRALDQAQWFEGVTQTLGDGGVWQASFSIDSPFPYAIDLTQTSPSISANAAAAVTNSGNTDFYPVFKVYGPIPAGDGFSVINDTTLQGLVYNTNLPGALSIPGGSYAEIDTFKGTIYMNGNGADLSAGIDPVLSNFDLALVIVPGVNNFEFSGLPLFSTATVTILMNNSWS